MTKGKLRRALRIRFIEVYSELVYKAVEEKRKKHEAGNFFKPTTPTSEKIADLMRKKIGYSIKTNNTDMVYSLLRLAEDLQKGKGL